MEGLFSSASVSRAAKRGLLILALINLFNYLDRYVVAALVQSLRADVGLQLSDAQAGWLMTGFILVYMTTSPFFGSIGDRAGRPKLIAMGVAIWSLATALGGLAGSFVGLFLARALVGVGEAAYGTIAPSLIADYFPLRLRGRAFAIFFAAIPIGTALGYLVGGLIDQHYGWRAAFFVAGVPGLLLAGLTLSLEDPPRGAQDGAGPAKAALPFMDAFRALRRNVPYVMTVMGYAAYTFGLGALAFWMPAFLERERGIPKAAATMQFGAVVVVTGLVGTFAGGWLGDILLRRSGQAYLWLSGISTLLAAPLVFVALSSEEPTIYWSAMVVSQLLIFASTGPVNSVIVNAVPAGMRATAVAGSIFCIHVLGDVPSPPLVGWLSDRSSLAQGVMIVPAAIVVAGLFWTVEAWRGDREARVREAGA